MWIPLKRCNNLWCEINREQSLHIQAFGLVLEYFVCLALLVVVFNVLFVLKHRLRSESVSLITGIVVGGPRFEG